MAAGVEIKVLDGVERAGGIVASSPDGKLTEHELQAAAPHDLSHAERMDVAATMAAARSGVLPPHLALAAAVEAQAAVPGASAPLWPSGSSPAFTVSGIDPSALNRAAWPARFSMANTPNRAVAFELLNTYPVTDETAVERALVDLSGDSDLADFLQRNESARVASLTDQEHYAELFGALPGEHKVGASAAEPPDNTITTTPDGWPIS